MKKITSIVAAVLVVGGIVALSLNGGTARALNNGGSGLSISPVRTLLTINPGESKTMTITVRNVTSDTTEYRALINDFVSDDSELGQPALILDENKFAPSHSLKRYIAPIGNVTVASGQSKDVKVTINVPADAAGGGYYGAIRFIPSSGKQGQNITLSASVGSLILVKVPGDIKEDMILKSFDVRRGQKGISGSSFFTTNKDLYAVVRMENRGNVHEQPFGKVRVLKGTKVVQEVEINSTDPRGNVLPDSTRRFEVKLDKVGKFGKYTVEGNFGYGDNGQLVSGKTSFWVVPLAYIVAGIIVVVLILAAIFGLPKAIKSYNKRVVRKAGRR